MTNKPTPARVAKARYRERRWGAATFSSAGENLLAVCSLTGLLDCALVKFAADHAECAELLAEARKVALVQHQHFLAGSLPQTQQVGVVPEKVLARFRREPRTKPELGPCAHQHDTSAGI